MRLPLFALVILPVVLGGCTNGMTGNPVLFPGIELNAAASDPAYQQRRGAVEITVKTGFPAILTEIENGGGPILTDAMDKAGVPAQDRPARIIQLQSDFALYEVNPGALVSALMVYGS